MKNYETENKNTFCALGKNVKIDTEGICSYSFPLAISYVKNDCERMEPINKVDSPLCQSKLRSSDTECISEKLPSKQFLLNPNASSFVSKNREIVIGSPIFSESLAQSLYSNSNNSEHSGTALNFGNLNLVNDDPHSILKEIRLKNVHKIVIGHLNINSIRNKIDMVSDLIIGKIDIFLITESKIDNTFPTSQFKISGYHLPYRKDRSNFGGGVLLYVRGDIPSKLVEFKYDNDIECIMIEITINKQKWLIIGIYNPNGLRIANCLKYVSKNLDYYFSFYDNIILLGDFNAEITDITMDEFIGLHNLKCLIREPTCFKSLDNPSCIDLILTNRYYSFQDTKVFESGLSDFHKITVTVLKTAFKKHPPKIVIYRDYKKFSQVHFREDLEQLLYDPKVIHASNDQFMETFMGIFNNHAPLKSKILRANDNPFMTKEIRKAIMIRSKLRNELNKKKTLSCKIAYKKQRNICTSLLRRTKKEYYSKLNPNNICDNRKFWKTVKPFFSEKSVTTENITIVDKNEIYEDDEKVSEIFNDFFSNAVNNLNIPKYVSLIQDSDESDPIMKAIIKYNNHDSIIKIREETNNVERFSFTQIELNTVENAIFSLNKSKACPSNSIPTHIIQQNCDIFGPRITSDLNKSMHDGNFPNNLKNVMSHQYLKKGIVWTNVTIDLLVSYLHYLRSLKG